MNNDDENIQHENIDNKSNDTIDNNLVQSILKELRSSDEDNSNINPNMNQTQNSRQNTMPQFGYNNAEYIIFDKVTINKEDIKLIDDKAKKIISEFKNQFEKLNKFNKETFIHDLVGNMPAINISVSHYKF